MPRNASPESTIAVPDYQAAANLSALIESTEDLIWSVDLNFGLLTFNRSLQRHVEQHWGTQAAIGKRPEDLLPPEVLENLTPEFVAPVVAYLSTEEVPDTGSIFIVGGGKVQRTALFQNEGVTFKTPPSVDDIASHWGEIDDLSAAKAANFSIR